MTEPRTSRRSLPQRHLSLRVPWHDARWAGTICRAPRENAACIALSRTAEDRDDDAEAEDAGASLAELAPDRWPPCVAERATFMAPFELTREVTHAYSRKGRDDTPFARYQDLLPTPLRLPPYSCAAVPFRWLLLEHARTLGAAWQLDYDERREPTDLGTTWVQDRENQRALLEGFRSAIETERSLVLIYAKATPLTESNQRVLVGVGHVKRLGRLEEYRTVASPRVRPWLWETVIEHSIRPDSTDGFLLPYHEILERARESPDIEPERYVAFAPEERRVEFSYASELVGHDGAIGALLACKTALERMRDELPWLAYPFPVVLGWIEARLAELWRARGPYPGLGAALCAFGGDGFHGHFLAHALSDDLPDDADPWSTVDAALRDPSGLPATVRTQITPTLRERWLDLAERRQERLRLLQSLARFELTTEQARRMFRDDERSASGNTDTDAELLDDPYRMVDVDRGRKDPVRVGVIDRGLFPPRELLPAIMARGVPCLTDPTDPRRVRALVTALLEHAATEGHTLLPRLEVTTQLRELGGGETTRRTRLVRRPAALSISPPCDPGEDGLELPSIGAALERTVTPCALADGRPALQLRRLSNARELIAATLGAWIRRGRRHVIDADWMALLSTALDATLAASGRPTAPGALDEDELRARSEKAAALKELAESRCSVLVGPAGTGKTTVLSVLCKEPRIRRGGVLLLAPTGRARVRLQQATEIEAQTIAQFLIPGGRFDPDTGDYRPTGKETTSTVRTAVVDEASMLTEPMLAALLDALPRLERLVLVGDPRQLPPIGEGRPFADLVTLLAPDDIEARFPRVAPGYAELTIRRRQASTSRDDLQLADWFAGRAVSPGNDAVFDVMGRSSEHLRFERWRTADELHELLRRTLDDELQLRLRPFDSTLGGKVEGDHCYFNVGATTAEAWQILSPVRSEGWGVVELNRFVQQTWRSRVVTWAASYRSGIPRPVGNERIVYGDKVVALRNHRRDRFWPADQKAMRYVANGELGVVTGTFVRQGRPGPDKADRDIEVEFASQREVAYKFWPSEFGENSEPPLELAYALTVHKAQGSEFGLVVLIVPSPCRLLSRELLYTALTRQRERVVVLHQGEAADLLRLADPRHSETARRLTNLFRPPSPVEVAATFLEDRLIHRTERGELVRSKSELIIANMMRARGIDYEYEKPLTLGGGSPRWPDFTIRHPRQPQTVYWEHLGMLANEGYRRKWNEKLAWYRANGVTDEGDGGPAGLLVLSRDDPRGGLDAQVIAQQLDALFGGCPSCGGPKPAERVMIAGTARMFCEDCRPT